MLPLSVFASAKADNQTDKKVTDENDNVVETPILKSYADSLQALVRDYQHAASQASANAASVSISPYFYQMVAPGTLYDDPVRQAMSLDWEGNASASAQHIVNAADLADPELKRLYNSRQALGMIYMTEPGLITYTQEQFSATENIQKDIDVPIKTEEMMKEQIQLSDLGNEEVGEVEAIVRKPNFWKFKGSNSLQLTQNYATDNWFQGKANHYNVLGIVAVEANFNNQRKVQWDNRLDLQLGFQTNSESEQDKFKPTNNMFRINSKLGVKAAKDWFYTVNVKGETQLVRNFQYNKNGDHTDKITITDFLSPLNVDVQVGIDWKLNKKKFNSSLVLAPCTYNMKYVDRLPLSTRYGVDEGKHTKHTFGPSATYKFTWQMASNIKWDSRLYWISNLSYTNIEFENTVTFSINKYLTSKFYFYPRFNDQSIKNRMPDADGNHNGTYWMFKEWLSLGVSYDW